MDFKNGNRNVIDGTQVNHNFYFILFKRLFSYII